MTVRESAGPVRVGVVGVGSLGLAIAAALLRSGFSVSGYRRGQIPPLFVDLGGTPVRSCAELAAHCDVVLSILPSDDALEDVVAGPNGLLATAHEGLVVAELSTVSITAKTDVRRRLAERGVRMLDGPISGTPAMVGSRSAAVLASGDAFDFERVRPVFDGFSDVVHYLGPFGTGTAMKLVSYTLLANHVLAAAEALALAERAGLDLNVVYEVVRSSIVGSTIFEKRAPTMIGRTYLPASGTIDTLSHGVEQVRQYAAGLDFPLPLTEATARQLDEARRAGRGHEDTAAMFDLLARATGD
jgi:3-hydroxyisobutyrate dehydrogenase